MPDVYKIMVDAESNKAFDVWSGALADRPPDHCFDPSRSWLSSYLNARTGEDPEVRADLRALLESARTSAALGDPAYARTLLGEMYDEARYAGLPFAPEEPDPHAADCQARDYAKDELRQVLPLQLWEDLDALALHLRVTGHRLRTAPGLDTATREDILYVCARASMALDLARPDSSTPRTRTPRRHRTTLRH